MPILDQKEEKLIDKGPRPQMTIPDQEEQKVIDNDTKPSVTNIFITDDFNVYGHSPSDHKSPSSQFISRVETIRSSKTGKNIEDLEKGYVVYEKEDTPKFQNNDPKSDFEKKFQELKSKIYNRPPPSVISEKSLTEQNRKLVGSQFSPRKKGGLFWCCGTRR